MWPYLKKNNNKNNSRNMAILTKFLDFAMFGTRDLGLNGKKFLKITISINHYICPIFHVENNLSKLQFNFAHFIGPILTVRGPAPFHPATPLLLARSLSLHNLK
jgi:hypothetical protein